MKQNPLWEAYVKRVVNMEDGHPAIPPNALEGGWTGLNAGLVMTCYWVKGRPVVHLTPCDPALRFWFDKCGSTV